MVKVPALKKNSNLPNNPFYYEDQALQNGFDFIIGVDEAGRGPLAGPVVASAIILKTRRFVAKIDDSKKISSKEREIAFDEIWQNAYVGIGIINETVIDTVNILTATFLAMQQAIQQVVDRLPVQRKTFLLVDGNRFRTELPYSYQTIVAGDSLSFSIACASIVAKVMRDRILNMYDRVFPGYGFKNHKGYPTESHRKAIKQLGHCPIHRRTFRVS